MTVAQLRSVAKEKGLEKSTQLKKQELVEALLEIDKKNKASSVIPASDVTYRDTVSLKPDNKKKEPVKPSSKRTENEKTPVNRDGSEKALNKKSESKKSDLKQNKKHNSKNESSPNGKIKKEEVTNTETIKTDIKKPEISKSDKANINTEPVLLNDPEDLIDQSNIAPTDESNFQTADQDTEGDSLTSERAKNDLTSKEKTGYNRGDTKEGVLEILTDGYGFIRDETFLPGELDVYVSPTQIRKMNLRNGDWIEALTKEKGPGDKFNGMLFCKAVNGLPPYEAYKRPKFENLTPIFPHERLHLETPGCSPSMRIMDILSPIGKGQRGMIVSQPKAGKTTLLKQIAKAVLTNNPEVYMIILLIDERPEEVTDMKESITGDNVTVVYSTFDELPENHKRVSEMVIERAKRLVEEKRDVVILLDSITRLARAYNLTCSPSGRTLSGGLDPAALHMPKKFFGAARCMREGGSLTILATALVETGSRMDDVVFEEFKGTGNMELVLDRNLSEKRVFPAIDLPRSSTRRDDLLLSKEESEANVIIRHAFSIGRTENMVEKIISLFSRTRNNNEFCNIVKKTKLS